MSARLDNREFALWIAAMAARIALTILVMVPLLVIALICIGDASEADRLQRIQTTPKCVTP